MPRGALLFCGLALSAVIACSDRASEPQRVAPPQPQPQLQAPPQAVPSMPEPPTPQPPTPQPPTPQRTEPPETFTVEDLLAAINASRTDNRLPPLALDPRLSAAAGLKLADMIARDYVDHADPDGRFVWPLMQKAGCRYRAAAENLATGYSDAQRLEQAWMKSPAHRDNILDRRNGVTGVALSQRPPLAVVLFADSCG